MVGLPATKRFLSASLILAKCFKSGSLVENQRWFTHILEHYTVGRFRVVNTYLIIEGNGPTMGQILRPWVENSKCVCWPGCVCPKSKHPETKMSVINLPFLLRICSVPVFSKYSANAVSYFGSLRKQCFVKIEERVRTSQSLVGTLPGPPHALCLKPCPCPAAFSPSHTFLSIRQLWFCPKS